MRRIAGWMWALAALGCSDGNSGSTMTPDGGPEIGIPPPPALFTGGIAPCPTSPTIIAHGPLHRPASDGKFLYAVAGSAIVRMSLDGAPAGVMVYDPNGWDFQNLVADDDYLYWMRYSALYRIAVSGGTPELLYDAGGNHVRQVLPTSDAILLLIDVIDDNYIGRLVVSIAKRYPFTAQTLTTFPGTAWKMAVRDSNVYFVGTRLFGDQLDGLWVTDVSSGFAPVATWPYLSPRHLSQVAIDGGSAYVLEAVQGALSRTDLRTGDTELVYRPQGVAYGEYSDGDTDLVVTPTSFWMMVDSWPGATLYRVARDGSSSQRIGSATRPLVAAGDSIYYTGPDPNIRRVCRDR